MKDKQVKVVQPEGEPEIAAEIIASSIVEMAKAGKALAASRLNRRAILVLLRDATGLQMGAIDLVLNTLPELENLYLKPKKK